jgi:branched-chain amino acid transport system permease protein
VRLSGVYLAMLTLAFAQIAWAIVYQWDAVTGGSNGLTGVWPADWLTDKRAYYALTLVLVAAPACAAAAGAVLALRLAMRAGATRRCAPMPSAST